MPKKPSKPVEAASPSNPNGRPMSEEQALRLSLEDRVKRGTMDRAEADEMLSLLEAGARLWRVGRVETVGPTRPRSDEG